MSEPVGMELDLDDRVSTGIVGLDDVLGGGLPRNHIYLIEGESGSGKTTLGLHFLMEGMRRGERGLWITMSETARELQQSARSHGWSLEGVEVCNLSVTQEAFKPGEKYSFFSPADVELDDAIKIVLEVVERVKPVRIVFDPFTDIRLLARDSLRYRRQIGALRDFFIAHGCTVLLTQESTRGTPGDMQAEALVHGYMTLFQDSPEYGGQRRRLRVHKMRGIRFRDGYHDYSIETGGIRVYPRLIAAEYIDELLDETVSSGLEGLDAILDGGVERGSSLLLMGPAGVGKSSMATQFAVAAVERGERVALFIFDETIRAFVSRSEKLGWRIREHVEAGRMRLRQIDSAEFSPGQFTHAVVRAVEEDEVRLVVIDSLSGYLGAMPEERFLTTHLHELLTYMSHRNVLTILTLAQHGVMGDRVQSPVDVSYLADSVVVLRYFEALGAVRRAMSVVKKRSGAHEVFIREIRIGPGGLSVGQPLTEFNGVLTGRPAFAGDLSDLARDRHNGTTLDGG